STDRYSLVGCSVAPGFEFEDFSLLRDDLETKEMLLNEFPGYRKFI
ncbi:MAG: cupin domain-containing protein, partial [Desulfobacterales bacterium]